MGTLTCTERASRTIWLWSWFGWGDFVTLRGSDNHRTLGLLEFGALLLQWLKLTWFQPRLAGDEPQSEPGFAQFSETDRQAPAELGAGHALVGLEEIRTD
jgi:hypothetical protein